jgi:glycosyltransferase involved in cell wall biosynthesis
VISIVIAAYNEAGRIGAQLGALAEQLGDDCEVVVADNGSSDATVVVVDEWATRAPVRVVDASARRGQAAARNIAVAEARGDLIVFVDADDVVLPGYVDAWRALSGDVVFASGPVIFFAHDDPPPRSRERAPRRLPVQLGFLPYALGANCAVRRDWFDRAGGFDETYPPSEDVELSWRLQLMGAELTFVPGAVVAKREAPSLRAMLRQYYRYGYRDPYLYRDYRDRGVPPPAVWPTVKSYLGLVARLAVLWRAEQRKRWVQQLGRRAGRLAGSVAVRTFYP